MIDSMSRRLEFECECQLCEQLVLYSFGHRVCSDRRPPIDGGYEHTLAVCVQPMVLMADWPVLLQFFEAWIEQGATKFYIYRNSHTPEVRSLAHSWMYVK